MLDQEPAGPLFLLSKLSKEATFRVGTNLVLLKEGPWSD